MKTEPPRRGAGTLVAFDGIGVSAGIAVGPAYVLESGIAQIP